MNEWMDGWLAVFGKKTFDERTATQLFVSSKPDNNDTILGQSAKGDMFQGDLIELIILMVRCL